MIFVDLFIFPKDRSIGPLPTLATEPNPIQRRRGSDTTRPRANNACKPLTGPLKSGQCDLRGLNYTPVAVCGDTRGSDVAASALSGSIRVATTTDTSTPAANTITFARSNSIPGKTLSATGPPGSYGEEKANQMGFKSGLVCSSLVSHRLINTRLSLNIYLCIKERMDMCSAACATYGDTHLRHSSDHYIQ